MVLTDLAVFQAIAELNNKRIKGHLLPKNLLKAHLNKTIYKDNPVTGAMIARVLKPWGIRTCRMPKYLPEGLGRRAFVLPDKKMVGILLLLGLA